MPLAPAGAGPRSTCQAHCGKEVWEFPPIVHTCEKCACTSHAHIARAKTCASFLLPPGDAVFGLAHGCLGSVVVSVAATLVPIPPTLTYREAATVPTVLITVQMALHRAGNMARGEHVLVHAAGGGVGLAAIQVAHAFGATVVATAGSASKRALVHSLGAQHVLGSRDTQFVSEAAELGGVDIVLNSLTSSGMVAGSLAALRRGGRFVEISKRDIWSPARMAQGGWAGLLIQSSHALPSLLCIRSAPPLPPGTNAPPNPLAERPDVAFSLLAVDFLPPAVIHRTLADVASALAEGIIAPLRHITHSLGAAATAFRQMVQASHVGKVVVCPGGRAVEGPRSLRTVAITGGSRLRVCVSVCRGGEKGRRGEGGRGGGGGGAMLGFILTLDSEHSNDATACLHSQGLLLHAAVLQEALVVWVSASAHGWWSGTGRRTSASTAGGAASMTRALWRPLPPPQHA
jgi:NADPH:quinone reductase-like Zn-dependent oxidoreductase